MRQRKKKPLREGMVYCKHCKGNGLIKPYRIEPFMEVTNKCKYCGGTGQRYWIDVMLNKIPEIPIKGFDIRKHRAWGFPFNAKSNRNRRNYSNISNILKHGTPLGTMQKLYSRHLNPIDFNTWVTIVKK